MHEAKMDLCGLEPQTFRVLGERDNQLHHKSMVPTAKVVNKKRHTDSEPGHRCFTTYATNAIGRLRTGLSVSLYPA